jgi:hypothetical protein
MQMDHWRVVLTGFPEESSGDVATKEGEYLGTWELIDDVFWGFTPDAAHERLFIDPHLGPFCARILAWHEGREE